MFLCYSIGMADWGGKKTLYFIEEYRKYTVLWRSFGKNYKSREERRSVLQELGEKYSLDSKSILNKIKSLRSYFHREHSKEKVDHPLTKYIVQIGLRIGIRSLCCKVIKQGKEKTQ